MREILEASQGEMSGLLKATPYKWVHWGLWEEVRFTRNCRRKSGSLEIVRRSEVHHWKLWEEVSFTGNCGKKSGSSFLALWSGVRNATFRPNVEASPTHSSNTMNGMKSWSYRGTDFGKGALNSNVTLGLQWLPQGRILKQLLPQR